MQNKFGAQKSMQGLLWFVMGVLVMFSFNWDLNADTLNNGTQNQATRCGAQESPQKRVRGLHKVPYQKPSNTCGSEFNHTRSGLVMVGAIVRGHEVVEGLTPLYQALDAKGHLSAELYRGDTVGNADAGGQLIYKAGHIMVGIDYEQLRHNGQTALRSLRVAFRQWSPYGPIGNEQLSKVHAAHSVKPLDSIRAPRGQVIVGLHGMASNVVNALSVISSKTRLVRHQEQDSADGVTLKALVTGLEKHKLRAATRLVQQQHQQSDDLKRTSALLKSQFIDGMVDGDMDVQAHGTDFGGDQGKLRLLVPGASVVNGQFEVNADDPERVVMLLKHLTAWNDGQPGKTAITITVNGKVVATDFEPQDGNFASDRFDLTKHAVAGINNFSIALNDATAQYWLESISVRY